MSKEEIYKVINWSDLSDCYKGWFNSLTGNKAYRNEIINNKAL